MSKDFLLAWPCSHALVEETVTLDSDRRTLATRQPTANTGSVRILVNNEFFIPQTGLKTVAQVYSRTSGPFTLGSSGDLSVTTSSGSTTVVLPPRSRITTEQVLRALSRAGFANGVAENINGHLVFSDPNRVGPQSFVRVSGGAASALGFDYQVGTFGKNLYPGWTLVERKPVFVSPVQTNPVLKVSYVTTDQNCLRCQGTRIENDLRFATDGDPILIDDEDLLYQMVLKILLTDKGSNPYHTWYGSTIRSRLGTKALGGTAASISEDVRKALASIQSTQREQAKVQVVTLKERLYSVQNVKVQPTSDPTAFTVDVTVQNASMEQVNLNIVFTVPGVIALAGTNGLSLGV